MVASIRMSPAEARERAQRLLHEADVAERMAASEHMMRRTPASEEV